MTSANSLGPDDALLAAINAEAIGVRIEYVRDVTRDAVAEYVAAGKTFVELIERIETADRGRVLGDLAIALADLYSAAGRLPAGDVTSDDLLPSGKVKGHDPALRRVLGADDFSWDSIDWEFYGEWLGEPYERWKFVLDLANDLDEACRDVQRDIALLRKHGPTDDALWQVRFGFWTHTSDHVVGALRLIHPYLSMMGGPVPSPDPQ